MARKLLLAPYSLSALPSQSPVYLALWVCQVIDDRCDSAYLPEIDHGQCPPLKLALPRKVSSLAVLRTCQVATASITWRYRIWKLRRRCSGPNYTVAMLRAGYKTRSIALDPAHSILRIASFHIHFEHTQSNEDHFLLPRCHRRPGFCCTSEARCWTIRHSRDAVGGQSFAQYDRYPGFIPYVRDRFFRRWLNVPQCHL
jgi:hypothetical protein